jgi:acetylornithine deacetylase/succinyl-diaminopimelate desuccinylase-like protein
MSEPTPSNDTIRAAVAAQLPRLTEELIALARIPSIAAEGFPPEPLHEAHDRVVALLHDAGVPEVGDLPVEGTVAPVILARVPGPEGAPTVLIYGHYDVVPPGDLSLWRYPPFEPYEADGAVHGRGASDCKSNIVAIAAALRALDGRPPVGLTLVLEGHEEFGSPFDHYPPSNPDVFACDAMIIADMGSVRPGVPTLTVALRGSVDVAVEVRTLAGDKHSGQFGGAAPDARLALVHVLASLHDVNGDVVVEGLTRTPWTGATYTDDEFRDLAEVLPGQPLLGTGSIGERIWSGPAITVTSFDAPPSASPINAVASSARATLNLRVHPEQDAVEARAALVGHLERQRPFGIEVTVTPGEAGNGVAVPMGGPGVATARAALESAWGSEPVLMAAGGSVPIVMSLHEAVPRADLLLLGAEDGFSNIHAPNERVLLDEVERTAVAIAVFLRDFASGGGSPLLPSGA